MSNVSVDKFQKIFEAIPDLYFLVDETGKHLDFKGNEKLLYLTPEMFLGKTIEQTLPEHISKIFSKAIKNTLETKAPTVIEYSLPINDFIHYYEARNLYFSENRVAIFVRDITKRKKLEQKLLDEKKFTDTVLNAQRDTLFVFEPSTGEAIRWNKAFSEISGYTNKEIANMRAPDSYYNKSDLEKATRAIREVNNEGTTLVEMDLITKAGKLMPFEYLGTSINDEEGNLKYIVSIGRDITERKKIEQKLKESEEKYRNLFNKSPLGIFLFDENGNFLEGNTSGSNSFSGFPSSISYGKNFIEIISLFKNSKELLQIFKKRAEDRTQGKELKPVEIEIIRPDGEKRWLYWQSSTVQLKDRMLIQAIVQDITESKRAEQKLKESEEKIKDERDNLINMLNSMEDGVYIVNENYDIEFVNPSLKKEFGPIGNKKCYEYFQNLSESCKWCQTQEITTQGSIRWELKSQKTNKIYEIITTPIKKSDDSVSKLVIFHDITDRKNAEQKLIESEDKFRSIAEQTIVGMSIIQDNKVKYVNQRLLDYFGYAKEEVEKWPPGYFINVIHPDFREMLTEIVNNNQSEVTKGPSHVEIKTVKKSGEIQWTEIYFRSIIFDGKPAVMNISIDITERKKATDKLKEARERADMYLNLAGVILVAINRNGNITLMNKKGYEILEYAEGELDGQNWFEKCIPSHYKEQVFMVFKELMNGEIEPVEFFENPVITKDGREKIVAWHNTILYDKNGNITGTLSSGEDITEHKKAEGKLKESEERYRILFESSPVGIGIADFEGNVYSINPMMEEITGYDLESYRKINLKNTYVNPDDRIKLLKEIKKSGKVRDYLVNLIRKNGEVYDALLNIETTDIMNKKFIITNIQDLSERMKIQKKLKELSKLKSELLTRTSHELKTPAMHIKGYADLLLHKYKKNLGIDELQIISHIKKGVLRLETLIYDIMHKAELDSGESELNKVSSNLSSLIELSIKELRSFAALRGHSIKLNIDHNLIISFDKEQIRHVLNNLITNAIKYTPLNGIIGISSTVTDDFITIAVQDNGIGLTEEQINLLFTQFGKIERYGQGFDIITEGSGLGLHIVKKIIDLHGGKIWVESGGINKGSTFYFTLPKA
ncbi:MAG: PAS domain S-box protein [Promethearchaeota archaeon]